MPSLKSFAHSGIVEEVVSKLGISLFPPQRELLDRGFLDCDCNFIVASPPGTGKGMLAFLAMAREVARGNKAVYISPLKSIVEEKKVEYGKICAKIGMKCRLGVFTGDRSDGKERDFDMLLTTPETLDSRVRRVKWNLEWLSKTGCVVVDEFHLIGDNSRGGRLEGLITRLSRVNPFARILCFSATIPNLDELAGFLGAIAYSSSWTRINVEKRLRLFDDAKEKEGILLDEVRTTVKEGGHVLVFSNSRRRTEALCALLSSRGIACAGHHAGMGISDRSAVELSFRQGTIQALVCTSTLEMGVNLPARKVVNYDSATFTHEGFVPLSVLSYVQRSGRAGRPGLDDFGESVLLLPSWSRKKDAYMSEEIEPVRSTLSKIHMSEQILAELSSGLSRTRDEIEKGFISRTLLYSQLGREEALACSSECISELLAAGLLIEKSGYLNATSLGRLASHLYLLPSSVRALRDLLESSEPTRFDIILAVCLLEECGPKCWANAEEMHEVHETLSEMPSRLLDTSVSDLQFYARIGKQAIFSSVKSAVALQSLLDGESEEAVASSFGMYTSDLFSLRSSACRLLSDSRAIFGSLGKDELATECGLVSTMLDYGLDDDAARMCEVPGLGPKRCKALASCGVSSINDLSKAHVDEVSKIARIGEKMAMRMIDYARNMRRVKNIKKGALKKTEQHARSEGTTDRTCPYRLKRSLDLKVDVKGRDQWLVSGGSDDHVVERFAGFECDCKDFLARRADCKHILAVKRSLGITIVPLEAGDELPLRDALDEIFRSFKEA